MNDETMEPGWYDDGTGTMRWWDGVAWTDDVLDPASLSAPTEIGSAGFPGYGQQYGSGHGPSQSGYGAYGDQGGYGNDPYAYAEPTQSKGPIIAIAGGAAAVLVIVLVVVLLLVNGGGSGGDDGDEGDEAGGSDDPATFAEDEIDLRDDNRVTTTLTVNTAGTYTIIADNGYSSMDITLEVFDDQDESVCPGGRVDEELSGDDEECEVELEAGEYEVEVTDYWGFGSSDRDVVHLVIEGPLDG